MVLVTGSAGRIGRAVVAELQTRGLPVRGFDRVPTPGLADCVVGDLTDGQALLRAAQDTYNNGGGPGRTWAAGFLVQADLACVLTGAENGFIVRRKVCTSPRSEMRKQRCLQQP